MSIKTVVKLSYNNTLRRFEAPVDSFDAFAKAVKTTLEVHDAVLRFTYTDEDADHVVFDSDAELHEALVHGARNGVLRVTCTNTAPVASPPAASLASPAAPVADKPVVALRAAKARLQQLRKQIQSLGKDVDGRRPALRKQIVAARAEVTAQQALVKQARQANNKKGNKKGNEAAAQRCTSPSAKTVPKKQFPLQIARKQFVKNGVHVKFITPEKLAQLKGSSNPKAVQEHRAALKTKQGDAEVRILGAPFVRRVRALADKSGPAAIERLVDERCAAFNARAEKKAVKKVARAEKKVVATATATVRLVQKREAAAVVKQAPEPEVAGVVGTTTNALQPLQIAKKQFLANGLKVMFLSPQKVKQLGDKEAVKAFREAKQSAGFKVLNAPFVKRARMLAKQHENDRAAAVQAIHQLVDNKSKVLSRKVPFPLQMVKKRFLQNGLNIKFITPEKRDQLKALPEKGAFQAHRRALEAEGDVVLMPAFVKRVRTIADTAEEPVAALHRLVDNKSKNLLSKGKGHAASPAAESARVAIAQKQAEIKALQQELKVLRRNFKEQARASVGSEQVQVVVCEC